MERKTFVAGSFDSFRFAILAKSKADRAAGAWANRSWKLPISGQLNPMGAWIALQNSVLGLASMGRKEDAAALRPLTEELLLTGAWIMRSNVACRTVAGIAAACARDWPAAEDHHLTAIQQMDTAPYKASAAHGAGVVCGDAAGPQRGRGRNQSACPAGRSGEDV